MHELSIATQIVDSLNRDLAEQPGRILAVRLEVGMLSGVVPDALQFAWEIVCEGSRFKGSVLQIQEMPLVAHCSVCGVDRELPSIDCIRCPVCGDPASRIVSGQQLLIRSVEIE